MKSFVIKNPKQILGLAVIFSVGFLAVVYSLNFEQLEPLPEREIAFSLTPNQHLGRLNQRDRELLRKKYIFGHCTRRPGGGGGQRTCGVNHWPSGDPSYDWDPFMNQIPRGSRAQVEIKCNPTTGKFGLSVYFPDLCKQNKNKCYFNNPYTPSTSSNQQLWRARGQSNGTPFSSQPGNWLASPGRYNADDVTDLSPQDWNGTNNFPFTVSNGGSNAVTEFHKVSDRKEWEGAKMTNTIWLQGDIAIHGSKIVTGRPESKGCIRLRPNDALALYNLTRKIGTRKISYKFHGYGPPDKQLGGKPACSRSDDQVTGNNYYAQTPAMRRAAQANSKKSYGWLARFFREGFRARQNQSYSPEQIRYQQYQNQRYLYPDGYKPPWLQKSNQ